MPLRDELIQRAIQQLAAAFARLVSRQAELASDLIDPGATIPAAEAERLRAELDALYASFMGSSAQLVQRLGSDDLIRVLGSAGYVDGERAYLLSSLLETEAQLFVSQGEEPLSERVVALRGRALDLMLEAGISGLGESDIGARVARLLADVPGELRPAASWERLVWFGFETGDFAAAENALFGWLDQARAAGADLERLGATGRNLYGRLAALDDKALAGGGLPRDELGEGSEELERRLA